MICSALNNFDADEKNIEREYLRFNDYDELVSYRLGIHAEYTTGMERMKYMASLAEKYKEPCFMHLCETESEVKGCVERWGMTPPQLLDSIGMFAYGGGGFHCVWMSDEDIELFARKKLWAVTNPGSNAKLASGIAPLDLSGCMFGLCRSMTTRSASLPGAISSASESPIDDGERTHPL